MSTEERKIALREKWFEFRKEAFDHKQKEKEKSSNEPKKQGLDPVFATILVAIIGFIGTALVTAINNSNENTLEQRKFESDLIKNSLEEKTQDNKIKALKLLTTLHLIKDSEIKDALNTFLEDTTKAKNNIPTDVIRPIENVGKSFTANGFSDYASSLKLSSWRPSLIVLHATIIPNKLQWGGISGHDRIKSIAEYYGVEQKWRSGPHLFISDDSIWVLTPLTKRGTHSPSWNKNSIGIEIVGDYNYEYLTNKSINNVVTSICAICKMYDIKPDSIKLHSEDPLTTRRNCPGKNVDKNLIISLVKQRMQS